MDTNVSFIQLTNIVRDGSKTIAAQYAVRNSPLTQVLVPAVAMRDGRLHVGQDSMRDAAMRTRAELGLVMV